MNSQKPRVLAFVNQKGGVSKTTLAAQVAFGLARHHGKGVLAIDMDPQANLTVALGAQGKEDPNALVYEILNRRQVDQYQTIENNLWLQPSTIDLARAEMGFINRPDSQFLLKKAFSSPPLNSGYADANWLERYDFVILDSPPNLGLLTLNCLVAATEVYIPLTCDVYAMNGVAALMDTIQLVKGTMNPSLAIGGVIPSRVDARRVIDRNSLQMMQEFYADLVFKTRIPESTALKEAGGQGKAIWDHDPKSQAAEALSRLCIEILERKGA